MQCLMSEVWDEADFSYADKHQSFAWVQLCFICFCNMQVFH